MNHKPRALQITGVSDPDGDTLNITTICVMQDEPLNGNGDGNTEPDALGLGTDMPAVLAERDGRGDGRVYHVDFMAEDPQGAACIGQLKVSVPQSRKKAAIDGGRLYPSSPANTNCTGELPNVPPVALDQSLSTPEDTPLAFQPDARDDDGDELAMAVVEAPQHGRVSGRFPDLVYTPEANFHGTDRFRYTVNDGIVESGEATVTIEVTPVNDAPVIPDQALSLDEDTTGTWPLSANDVDGDSLVYAIFTAPAHGEASISGGNLDYGPYENYFGGDRLVVRVTDPSGVSDEAVIDLEIRPVNDPPRITTAGVASAFQDSPYFYGPQASEPDGDPLSWELLRGPDGMVFSPVTGGLYWTPDADDVGFHDVVLRVDDGTGLADEQRYRIIVEAYTNEGPWIDSIPGRTAHVTERYRYAVQATDPEHDPLSYELVEGPQGMTVSFMTGEVLWTPTAEQMGVSQALIRVSDPDGATAEQRWDIGVEQKPGNSAPVITSSPGTNGRVDQHYEYRVLAGDVDGDLLEFGLSTAPTGMTVSPDGLVSYVPDSTGEKAVILEVHDGKGGKASQSWVISVLEEHTPHGPVITSQPPDTLLEGELISYLPEVSDQDSDEIFQWSGSVAGVDASTGQIALQASQLPKLSLESKNHFCQKTPAKLDVELKPVTKWHWDGSESEYPNFNQVFSVPITAPLQDTDGDGRLGEGDKSAVIFFAYVGRRYNGHALMRAIDAESGEDLWVTPASLDFNSGSSVAVADMDKDGDAEIVAGLKSGGVGLFDHEGNMIWRSDYRVYGGWTRPSIADINQDGTPEILYHGAAIDINGKTLWEGANKSSSYVVADIDLDGENEVVGAGHVYDANGEHLFSYGSQAGGFFAVGNLDDDPYAEIVRVAQSYIMVAEHNGTLKWWSRLRDYSATGGAPTIADLDGDNEPEIGVAGERWYMAYERDGRFKWWSRIRDRSSEATASSVFDFNGDGKAEVVYGDEYTLHFFDGTNGGPIYETASHSVTANEYPVIADIDRDGSAEVLVANNNAFYGWITGIHALEAANDDWVGTRNIWNQFAYNINNINDDLTVPAHPEKSWLTHNTFRLNAFPDRKPLDQPDLAVSRLSRQGDAIEFSVLNRGLAPSAATSYRVLLDGVEVANGLAPGLKAGESRVFSESGFGELFSSVSRVTVEVSETDSDCQPGNASAEAEFVELTVTDKYGLSDTQRWLVSVRETNDQPVFVNDLPTSLPDGEGFSHALLVNDPDRGDDHRFELFAGPSGLDVDEHSGELRWDVPAGLSGTYEATIRVEDLAGETDTLTWAFEVAPPNGNIAPEITSRPVFSGNTLEPYAHQAIVKDDGSTFTWQLLEAPAGMTVDASGLLSWQPDAAGNYPVTLQVTDEGGRTDTQEWVIIVTEGTNENPPVFDSEPPSVVAAGSVLGYALHVSDPDGDAVSLELLEAPDGANLESAGEGTDTITGTLRWPVPEAANGTAWMVLRATDANGNISEQVIELEILPAGTNLAPDFLSQPRSYAYPGQPYSYDLGVTDPEGGAVSLSLDQAPAGAVLTESGVLNWTPDATLLDTRHDFRVTATDPVGNTSAQIWRVYVVDSAAPQILSLPRTDVRIGDSYQYTVNALDPEGETLSYALSQAPAGMTVSSGGLVRWTPAADQAGVHEIRLTATDSQGNVTPQGWNLDAWIDEHPTIHSEPVTGVVQGHQYRYQLEASDPRDPVLHYSLAESPEGMSVSAGGEVTWAPGMDDVGEHRVVVRVDDGRLYTDQGYTLVVDATAPALTADVSIEPGYARPGEDILVRVSADGGAGALDISASLDGDPLVLVDGQARVSFTETGRHTVGATVTDGTDTITREAIFAVGEDSDTNAPVVSLSSPTWNQEVTAPISVTGTVNDTNLAEYLVAWKRPGTDEQQVIARGTAPVTDGELATFDPSLLQNGLYHVIVQATDLNGQTNSTGVLVRVTGDLKVGNFSFTVEDLNVPMAGIPIRVTRTYDSRAKHRDMDFGFGWSIGYQDVKIDESGEPSQGWRQTTEQHLFIIDGEKTAFKATCTRSVSTREVAITLPGGEVHRFTARAEAIGGGEQADSDPDCYLTASRYFNLRFEPDEDTASSLSAQGVDSLYLSDLDNGNLAGDLTSGDPVPVNRYRLTTREGYVYELDQGFGVDRVITPNGQTLEYTDNGIFHSAGKSVTFERGAHGRITAIVDPGGNRYEYRRDSRGDLVAMTDPLGNESSYAYNRHHGLVDMRDALGRRIVRNVYDDEGRLVAQEDNQGHRTEFRHDLEGRQSVVTDRRGNATVLYYNDTGDVLSRTDALGNTTSYTYDADRNQTSETNPLGETSTATYNAAGDQLTQTDPLGNTTAFTYNQRGQELTIRDARGNRYANSYDGVGNLTAIEDPQGNTASNTVNAEGLVTASTDLAGHTTTYAYDSAGNKVSETDPAGNVTTWTYDDNGNVLTESATRTVNGQQVTETTTFEYDALNRVVATTDSAGNTTRTEYDAAGNEAATVDAGGRRTEYDHDAYGGLVETRYPDGTTEIRDYDAEGNLVAETDRLGRTTTHQYDALNRRVGTTWPDGSSTATEYDKAGRVIAEVDERGNRTEYEYDAAGRRAAVINALGNRHAFDYDADGNLVSETDANGHTTTYSYNKLGQKTRTTYADGSGTSSVHDPLSRKLSDTDQAGVTTQYAYDALGRLTKVTDAAGGETTYTYDSRGNKLTQTDAEGRSTSWTYDALGRVTSRTLPMGQSESFEYDTAGNVTRHVDFKGQVTTSQYDTMDRLIQRSYDDGTVETWTYDAAGRKTSASQTMGGVTETTLYGYDARDRLIREEKPDGSVLTYDYDAAGNKTSQTTALPDGNSRTTTYGYDALNRLVTVNAPNGTTTYTYDASGNRRTLERPNGVITTYTYDSVNRLTDQVTEDAAGNVLTGYSYTLDPTGRRTRIDEAGGRSSEYGYDSLYRLTSETITDPVNGNRMAVYSYDAVGNRTEATVNGITTAYSYDDNDRLTSEGAASYSYDLNGNTVQKTEGSIVTSYSYDARNRLVEVFKPTATLQYGYDTDGIRTSKAEGGTTTHYVVDHNRQYAQVLAELENGSLVKTYTYGDDLVSQEAVGGSDSFYLYDGLGTTRGLTDGSGVLSDEYFYEAFGELLASTGSTENSYLFTGEQFDADLGQYYLRARYYDPAVGRFTQMDTWQGRLQEPVTLHKYLYANGDPANLIDPSGHFSILEQAKTANAASNLYTAADVTFDLLTGNYAGATQTLTEEIVLGKLGHMRSVAKQSDQFMNLFGKVLRKNGKVTLRLGKPPSSKVLRQNMENVLGKAPPGHQAHHIVGKVSSFGERARKKLDRLGIDVNSPSNGVFLPSSAGKGIGSIHRGKHTASYEQAVWEYLRHAKTKEQAVSALAEVRRLLLSGQLALNAAR